jgi:putative aldouronate transport system substrate-binding protein
MSTHVSRRGLLRGALGGSALGAAGLDLSACGGKVATNSQAGNDKVALPKYLRYDGVRADLPGNGQGLADGFYSYPQAVQAGHGKPGDGKEVTALVDSPSPIPPGVDRNRFWQELNRRVGSDLKITIIPTSDWNDKFATTIAGGQLPDLVEIWTTPPPRADMLAAQFLDISEYVSGDAVKEYPFLANIPTDSWRQCVYNGGIYGVPVPRGAMSSSILYRRDDLLRAKGLDADPKSYADFAKLCKDATDTRRNVWALGGSPLALIQQMLGVPNNWQLSGGKLTHANELPGTKEALDATHKLYQAGVIHPDSFSANVGTLRKAWLNAGSCLFVWDTYPAWPGYYLTNTAGPSFDLGAMAVPGYQSGVTATPWLGNPTHNLVGFAKSAKSRVKTLLRICDWLSAPFGTAEYLFRKYGIEHVDYTLDRGSPTRTDTGRSETSLSLGYLADAPQVFYQEGLPNVVRKEYGHQRKLLTTAVPDPTLGLVSQTQTTKGSQLDTAIGQAQNDIMQGKRPVSDWDAVLKDWRSSGGDRIRAELEKALQERG